MPPNTSFILPTPCKGNNEPGSLPLVWSILCVSFCPSCPGLLRHSSACARRSRCSTDGIVWGCTCTKYMYTPSAAKKKKESSPSSAGGSRVTGMARVCASAANKAALDCSSSASSRSTAPMSFATRPSTVVQTRHDADLVASRPPPPPPPRWSGACPQPEGAREKAQATAVESSKFLG